MNWKEQFDKEFGEMPFTYRGMKPSSYPEPNEAILNFISTEIIEKLISDIPNSEVIEQPDGIFWRQDYTPIKQQLKDKWLS